MIQIPPEGNAKKTEQIFDDRISTLLNGLSESAQVDNFFDLSKRLSEYQIHVTVFLRKSNPALLIYFCRHNIQPLDFVQDLYKWYNPARNVTQGFSQLFKTIVCQAIPGNRSRPVNTIILGSQQ